MKHKTRNLEEELRKAQRVGNANRKKNKASRISRRINRKMMK